MTQWFRPRAFAAQRTRERTETETKHYRLHDSATHPVDQPRATVVTGLDGKTEGTVPNTAVWVKTEHHAFVPYGDGTQLPLGGFKQVSKHRAEDYARPLTVDDIEERLDREFLRYIEEEYADVVGPLRYAAAQGYMDDLLVVQPKDETNRCATCQRPRDNKHHPSTCPICLASGLYPVATQGDSETSSDKGKVARHAR